MKWTEQDIPNLSNKIAIVTGANSGIGYYKSLFLAKHECTVILAVRSLERGDSAKEKILVEVPNATIDVMKLDLNDFESIHTFSTEFHKNYQKLDFLFNNAGIMTTPYQPTKQGLESQIGVNHFGHFLLTSLLFDLLKKTPQSRIINTASIAHNFGNMKPSTFMYNDGNRYNKSLAYAQSKLANLLFTKKLSRLVEENNLDILVLASHPGISATNLGRHVRENKLASSIINGVEIFRQTADKGALPALLAATDKNAINGNYYGPSGVFHTKGTPKKQNSNRKSKSIKLQDLLWEESVKITKSSFDFS